MTKKADENHSNAHANETMRADAELACMRSICVVADEIKATIDSVEEERIAQLGAAASALAQAAVTLRTMRERGRPAPTPAPRGGA